MSHPDDESRSCGPTTPRPSEVELVAGLAGAGAVPRGSGRASRARGRRGCRAPTAAAWSPRSGRCRSGGLAAVPAARGAGAAAREPRERAQRLGLPGGHRVEGRVLLDGGCSRGCCGGRAAGAGGAARRGAVPGRARRRGTRGGGATVVRAPSGRPRWSARRSRPAEGVDRPLAAGPAHLGGPAGVGDDLGEGGGEVGDVPVRVERGAGAVGGLVDRHQPAGGAVGGAEAGVRSTTTSGMPPVAVATTAVSQAIASRLTMPSGS